MSVRSGNVPRFASVSAWIMVPPSATGAQSTGAILRSTYGRGVLEGVGVRVGMRVYISVCRAFHVAACMAIAVSVSAAETAGSEQEAVTAARSSTMGISGKKLRGFSL